MKIQADLVQTQQLVEGDLFSTMDQRGWDLDMLAIKAGDPVVGMRVYIRSAAPCPKDQVDQNIYRITILKDKACA